jgi:hypothetical protein
LDIFLPVHIIRERATLNFYRKKEENPAKHTLPPWHYPFYFTMASAIAIASSSRQLVWQWVINKLLIGGHTSDFAPTLLQATILYSFYQGFASHAHYIMFQLNVTFFL